MKQLSIALIILGLTVIGIQIKNNVSSSYQYENQYAQLWNLADKSSTIKAKQQYIGEFVKALEAGKEQGAFATHNAVWLKTPDNSFDSNLAALKTLADRLTEIQKMDPSSFEYNTTMQQITGQEQGEAAPMLKVFEGCYQLENFPSIWGWIGHTVFIFGFLCIIGTPIVLMVRDLA